MSGTQIFSLITGMLSGLALFMFGMNVMSDTLTQMAGGQLSRVIDKLTEKRISGWAFGTTLAIFVQSSVTTVMTVGLVNSGIMKVAQAVNVMIGASLGTTATAWLLSLNSLGGPFWLQLLKPSSFTPFLAIGGVVSLMFANTEKKRALGMIVVGFSVMMIGMDTMSSAVEPMQNVPAFNQLMFRFTNPFLGVIVGIICTLIIQSSAATIGILQALAMSVGVTFGMAIPIVCGAQIGTCLTAILASLGSNNKGKRAALVNLLYNVIRNTLFLIIFFMINKAVHFPFLQSNAGAVGIAAFHTSINLLGSAVFLPLGNLLVKLAHIILPFNKEEKKEEAETLTILNPIFLSNPAFALDQVKTASGMLADVLEDYYEAFLNTIPLNTTEEIGRAEELGEKAQRYADQIKKYCISISERHMQDKEARTLVFLNNTLNDFTDMIGKITDMRKSIRTFREKNGILSNGAEQDLKVFGSAVQEILENTVNEYSVRNTRLASTIQVYREIITDLHGTCSKRNVRRLHSGELSPDSSSVIAELFAGYELIVDRCDSIASHILFDCEEKNQPLTEEQYEMIRDLFKDKYSELE